MIEQKLILSDGCAVTHKRLLYETTLIQEKS